VKSNMEAAGVELVIITIVASEQRADNDNKSLFLGGAAIQELFFLQEPMKQGGFRNDYSKCCSVCTNFPHNLSLLHSD